MAALPLSKRPILGVASARAEDAAAIVSDYVRSKHNVLLGPRTAAEVVRALVRSRPFEDGADEDLFAEVRGRDLVSGLAKTIVRSRVEVRDAIRGMR